MHLRRHQTMLKRENFTKAGAWLCAGFLLLAQNFPLSALAQTATTSPATASQSSSRNLDFSSTQASIAARNSGTIVLGGHLRANGLVRGGTAMSVTEGMLLTPAQNAALWQSVNHGQHILINQAGAAIGGTANISSQWAGNISSLVVPAGVQVNAIGFNQTTPLNVTDTATIGGAVHTLQNAPAVAAVLNLGSLNVLQGGLLSAKLPANMHFLSNVFASSSMTLNVVNNVVNQGKITTPGDLNITAGGSLTNSGAITA